ncbi:hypothetical protein PIROE2DRAFT_43830 [Piromyces sp. E2]|nr:hypothetical protein PIROE2DRAFT_43830 [Piromyces sp. E2]|eukprot:OUM62928.1 hypothetical protein PIROE2DRAFT_43830 [Piromyces sp. E2]
MLKLLLTEGKIDPNAKDPSGWTALHLAAQEGQYEIVKTLIKVGNADVNEEDKNFNTPLHVASQYGNHPIAQHLIMNKARIDFKNLDGLTPLHNGWTALHWACYMNNAEIVKLLLENNANTKKKTRFGIDNSDELKGKTAKEIATFKGYKDVLSIFKAKMYMDTAKFAFKIITKTADFLGND